MYAGVVCAQGVAQAVGAGAQFLFGQVAVGVINPEVNCPTLFVVVGCGQFGDVREVKRSVLENDNCADSADNLCDLRGCVVVSQNFAAVNEVVASAGVPIGFDGHVAQNQGAIAAVALEPCVDVPRRAASFRLQYGVQLVGLSVVGLRVFGLSVAAVFADLVAAFVLRATRFVVTVPAFVALAIMLVAAFLANEFGIVAVGVCAAFLGERAALVCRLYPHAEIHVVNVRDVFAAVKAVCAILAVNVGVGCGDLCRNCFAVKPRQVRFKHFNFVAFAGELVVAQPAQPADSFAGGFGCVPTFGDVFGKRPIFAELPQHVVVTRRFNLVNHVDEPRRESLEEVNLRGALRHCRFRLFLCHHFENLRFLSVSTQSRLPIVTKVQTGRQVLSTET